MSAIATISNRATLVAVLAFTLASLASAGQKQVQYADVPSWALPAPKPTESRTPDGAPLRVVYSDTQIHVGPDGLETFYAYRVKILRPEALAAGNIFVSWNPDAGEAKIHRVRIIRDKEVIDVLKSTEFQVVQREGFLERAILNGELTATLQSPGLRVGDELEFAATIRRKDPTLGDHAFGFAQLPPTGLPGAFRIRVVWPKAKNLHWRASADVTGTSLVAVDGQEELVYELRDPRSAVMADGAPARFNVRRLIEVSDFDSWSNVSRRMWPLFEKASVLGPESPVRKEITRIATTVNDPIERMKAALQLVQDRIRYVYIGLNGGNFMPATADETWDRRFGDCKAKTALLLAVLQELGIRAEPVLVNLRGADGINERLPTPGVFDHVLVRVNLNDKVYWLDGSRLGDRALDSPVPFRWALPLRSDGADLERVPSIAPTLPDSIFVMDIDSSNGFEQKPAIKLQQVMRGDSALQLRSMLMALPAEDADRAIRGYLRQTNAWVEPNEVSWRYDEQRGTLLLSITGQGKIDWAGDDSEGRSVDIPSAGFTPPAEYHRPKEQDQTAPWITKFPAYQCWATAIHLPRGDTTKWKWDYFSDPVDTYMGGVHYWRVADLRDGVMRTVMSRRTETPEISAAQAEYVNKRLPTFNNKISRVYQVPLDSDSNRERMPAPPFQADTDWTSLEVPCGLPNALAIRNLDGPAQPNWTPRLVTSSCQKPTYPAESRRAAESGTVQLRLVVNESGKVVESKVTRSSGHERLDTAARAALERCNFDPAIRDGAPRTAPIQIEYVWSLTGPSGVRLPVVSFPNSCKRPPYPKASRRMNEQGTILLRFFIDEAGTVAKREVERSSGYDRLDDAAASALSLCKFAPATFDGRPTGAWTRMEYVFQLE